MDTTLCETIKTRDSIFVMIHGKNLKKMADFYSLLQQNLLFPDYFGHNMDALFDMLSDLNWLDYENIFVIIREADTFFSSFPKLREEIEQVFEQANAEQMENKQVRLLLSDLHDL
jgi:RNAse (barnase) inhibitor barstar